MGRDRGAILHVIDTGGPGGAETVFLELVTRLADDGWRCVPLVPNRDWLLEALNSRGFQPFVVPSTRGFDGVYLLRLLGLARQERALLIQTHLLASAVYGSLAARLLRLPLVATFHGVVDIPMDDPLLKLKARILARRATRVVCVSESLREAIGPRFLVGGTRSTVVRNGIVIKSQAIDGPCFRSSLGIRPDTWLIGAVGNIRASKDYSTLLRAAAILHARLASFHVVIVGDTRSGPLHGELLALRSELGLDDMVTFTGFREDTPSVFAALDAYVLSSSQEGFSLSTVEAMAAGKPVVATRSGGPEEIITHGHDGLLVPVGDPEALADALDRVRSNPELSRALGDRGRVTARERFSVERMVAEYAAIYQELLGRERVRS